MNIFKQKLKKSNNKKGFTLVEIIVVLVILAVLAAAAIPTMLGFVEEAKGKAEIANARAAYVAAQSIVTEEYASGKTGDKAVETKLLLAADGHTIDKAGTKKIDTMLGADMDKAKVKVTVTDGKVTEMVYTSPAKEGKSQYKVTIKPEENAVVEKVTAAAETK